MVAVCSLLQSMTSLTVTLFLGRCGRELMTDQSKDHHWIANGELTSFTGLLIWNMGEWLLIVTELTQNQQNHESWTKVTAHTEAENVDCSAQHAGSSTSWRVPFLGGSIGFSHFQTHKLVSASSSSFACLSTSHQSFLLIYTLGGRRWVNLASFRDFLKLFCCLFQKSKEVPCRMECFTSL